MSNLLRIGPSVVDSVGRVIQPLVDQQLRVYRIEVTSAEEISKEFPNPVEMLAFLRHLLRGSHLRLRIGPHEFVADNLDYSNALEALCQPFED
ncbi:MAG: uncharacterized protein KVP18_002241 [Porospora cf. gigantea A]|uniref:uncharacterized protein n=1 Tax=Porospora cf. gigantea A TaxID=2853593 RepID=UPI00355A6294|nr:MAG: hypothetical protein KVP18_002241 [Porospora cf. gigantea A]